MNRPGIDPVAFILEDGVPFRKKTPEDDHEFDKLSIRRPSTACCLRYRFVFGLILGALVGIVFMASRCNTHMEKMFDTLQSGRPSESRAPLIQNTANVPSNLFVNTPDLVESSDGFKASVQSKVVQSNVAKPLEVLADDVDSLALDTDTSEQDDDDDASVPVAKEKGKGNVKSNVKPNVESNPASRLPSALALQVSSSPDFKPSARCQVTPGQNSQKRNFNVVLLSSFPRSGSSWSRLLLHGGHQYMDRGLSTSSSMDTIGENQMYQMSTCKLCRSKVNKYILATLKIAPDPFTKGDQANMRNFYGINEKAVTAKNPTSCKEHFRFREDNPKWRQLLPPVLIKSHHPSITDNGKTEAFVDQVSHVIHLVRNPFDNLASRFLGTKHKFQVRWDELVAARDKGETTKAFADFIKNDIKEYIKFHQYWLDRRETDAKNGIPTLFTRYESLCESAATIVPEMVKFGGWNYTRESFACTLQESPCVADTLDLPNHAYIFTDEQKQFIIDASAPILQTYGYVFDKTFKMTLSDVSIPMCNS
eukprot:m.160846 g.160846  ORF g.160846 m.160846 type:complete len:535 (-) comp31202_c0_seq2:394-1998(-)